MSNFTTFFNNMAKLGMRYSDELYNNSDLAALVVRDDLGIDADSLITSWAINNGQWLDFYFSLRPDWLHDTPDERRVNMCVSIFTDKHSWYVRMVIDETGNIESWGEKEFKSAELEEYSMPVKFMLTEIHKQYEQKQAAEKTTKFRITFRSEIYVDASSEEEAQYKFGSMNKDEIVQYSNFVEIVSCEK
jgi:hypothetical protein